MVGHVTLGLPRIVLLGPDPRLRLGVVRGGKGGPTRVRRNPNNSYVIVKG